MEINFFKSLHNHSKLVNITMLVHSSDKSLMNKHSHTKTTSGIVYLKCTSLFFNLIEINVENIQ